MPQERAESRSAELDQEAVGAPGRLRDPGRGDDQGGGGLMVVGRTDMEAVDAVRGLGPSGRERRAGAHPASATPSAASGTVPDEAASGALPDEAASGTFQDGGGLRHRPGEAPGAGEPAGLLRLDRDGRAGRQRGQRGRQRLTGPTTTVGGSRRERASAATSDLRTSSGVPASTPSAASTAMTVSSGTDTVTSGDGE
ncbi:hypothetical protein BSAF29S_00322 [Bacillus safensis subsp. safensis]